MLNECSLKCTKLIAIVVLSPGLALKMLSVPVPRITLDQKRESFNLLKDKLKLTTLGDAKIKEGLSLTSPLPLEERKLLHDREFESKLSFVSVIRSFFGNRMEEN